MVNADDTTGGTSSTTSSGSTSSGSGLPAWIWNPRDKILGIVVAWLIAGIIAVVDEIGQAIGLVFAIVGDVPRLISRSLVDAFGKVGVSILDVVDAVLAVVADLAVSAGPFAPLLVGLAIAGVAYVLKFVLSEVTEVILFWR